MNCRAAVAAGQRYGPCGAVWGRVGPCWIRPALGIHAFGPCGPDTCPQGPYRSSLVALVSAFDPPRPVWDRVGPLPVTNVLTATLLRAQWCPDVPCGALAYFGSLVFPLRGIFVASGCAFDC